MSFLVSVFSFAYDRRIHFIIWFFVMTLLLIPPSEGKQAWWTSHEIVRHYDLALDHGYPQAHGETCPAIDRYSGVMYKAIAYQDLDDNAQKFFDTHVRIVSGMWWLLTPQDMIPDYKLPISQRWLVPYRKKTLTDMMISDKIGPIVSLLPMSYHKMIDWKRYPFPMVHVTFGHADNKKMIWHHSKTARWERVRDCCVDGHIAVTPTYPHTTEMVLV